MKRLVLVIVACLVITVMEREVIAIPIFVGTFQTDDGPLWRATPKVFSAREAAAEVFGGSFDDYLVSTDSSSDYNTITYTGWYSSAGVWDGWEYDQDYSKDNGLPGYAATGWVDGEDISAYVKDNADGPDYTMYVWRDDSGAAAVPEPATVALLGIGLVGLAGAEVRRRRKKKESVDKT